MGDYLNREQVVKLTKYKPISSRKTKAKELRRKQITTLCCLFLLGGPCAIVGFLAVIFLLGTSFENKLAPANELVPAKTLENPKNTTTPKYRDLLMRHYRFLKPVHPSVWENFFRPFKRFFVETVRNGFFSPDKQTCLAENSRVYVHNSFVYCDNRIYNHECFIALDNRCLSNSELEDLEKGMKSNSEKYKHSKYYCVTRPSQQYLMLEKSRTIDPLCCRDIQVKSEYVDNMCQKIGEGLNFSG